ncbi:MAG: methylenetetrahydrofolate reductase C-terminal domain-containing protein [Deltaproteobacteria bacterium]|nr:methylenetetrahydrofolate reductase C-terminal domain-containing protein [Deltaproteobacteria bacterium]
MEHLGTYQRSLLDHKTFSVTWELVPGRGAFEKAQEVVFASAEQAAKGGKVQALTITDNPGGNPAISAEMLGAEVNKLGIEPLVHFTCKDKNRNQLEGLLYGMERANVRNLLIMTGDYTYSGFQGRSKPVFDVDPTMLLALVTALNNGMEVPTLKGTTKLAQTHFFAGAAASPFKALESEQMTQYYKLKKKLESGAQFIVPQLGYDARKFHELILMMKRLGYGHVPVLGTVYLLPLGAAKLMNRNGLPGCVATSKLVSVLEQEATAADKGKGKRLERAAKMYAFMKGMGFAGVHVGGHGMTYQDLEFIIGKGEELAPNWLDVVPEFDFPQPNGWYYFEKDPKTGLNTETPVDRSKHRPSSTFGYKAFRTLHGAMFEKHGFLFKPMQSLAKAIDGSSMEHLFERVEHFMKVMTNECMHCGDCGLFDLAYLCPTSQCSKGQRNGPCGGSFEGWCEVYPKKKQCIYVRAYDRLKSVGEEDTLGAYHVPPVNYDLLWTSSWLNFYMGRDHSAKRLGIEPPEKK